MPFEFLLALSVEHSVRHWLFRLGGVGLIVLGLADNSVVPLPGSMDAFTILLSAARREYWWYYAIMATVGAVLGGYITYRLAAKGGKEALEKRIGKNRAEKVYKKFDQGGFLTVLVGAMLPPPFPIVPVLLTAGALQYPRRNFLTALALGRGARFLIGAWLGRTYGTHILGFFRQYYKPVLYGLIGLAVVGGVGALIYYKHWRKTHPPKPSKSPKDQQKVA
jgi:membrane protein YqaA with SNARE-associated domain